MDTTVFNLSANNQPSLLVEESTILLVEKIISQAFGENSSDIHIDPLEDKTLIRFRHDGIIYSKFIVDKNRHTELVARIKVLSSLRTDLHSIPQDGRIQKFKAIPCDIRISIMPTYFGENIVLRILRNSVGLQSLDDLALEHSDKIKIEKAISKKSGLIILTGPTGSGKTTTLYTLLSQIPRNRLIITIEDPIEYTLEHIRQILVNTTTGLTFETGLRSILRQNPDVIMVGEIRDPQTASIAVNAALTGHLVLTTLHTKDAVSVIPRLKDMGIPPYLIAATVELVIAQRLVRTLCINCLKSGCTKCNYLGYVGRIGLYEVLTLNQELRELIYKEKSTDEILLNCQKSSMSFLNDAGKKKADAGITSIEEVLRAIS